VCVMKFDGERLQAVLQNQTRAVVVRDHCGRVEAVYQDARRALDIITRGAYYGIGNRKRIWYIQPQTADDQVVPWGTNLELGAVTRDRRPRISHKATAKGGLRWGQRPDRSRPGITGQVRRVWLHNEKPDTRSSEGGS
jgi:hypothetical protein